MTDKEQIAALEETVRDRDREIFELEVQLDIEKTLNKTLEDVVRATKAIREQA